MEENVNATGKSRGERLGGASTVPARGIAAILARARSRSAGNGGNNAAPGSDGRKVDNVDSVPENVGGEISGTSNGARNPIDGSPDSGGRNRACGERRKRGRPRKQRDPGNGTGIDAPSDGTVPNPNDAPLPDAPGTIRLEPVPFPKRGRPKKSPTLNLAPSEISPLLGVAFAFAAQLGGNHWLLKPEEMAILSDSLSKALSTIKNETVINAVESTVGIVPWITFLSVSAMIVLPRIQLSRTKGGTPNVKTTDSEGGFSVNGNGNGPDVPGPHSISFPSAE